MLTAKRLITRGLWIFLMFLVCSPYLLLAAENQPPKTVLLAILARNKAHCLPRFLSCIDRLDYDKKLISIYINTNNNEDNTQEILEKWAAENKSHYNTIVFESHEVKDLPSARPHEWTPQRFKVLGTIRNTSMQKAKDLHSDYYFVVDCDNFIKPYTLTDLVQKDKPIIAPMLRAVPEKGDAYSNYFCSVTDSGYYQNHPDYVKILYRSKVGTFKVPVVHCTYLINTNVIDKLGYIDGTDDYEFVIFSRMARKNNVDQYITNEKDYGVLIHFYDDLPLAEEKRRVEEIRDID